MAHCSLSVSRHARAGAAARSSSSSAAGSGSTAFRIRSNFNLSWDMGDFGVSWTARYYSGMREGCTYFTSSPTGVPPVTEPHLECTNITYAPTGALLANGDPASGLSRRREVGSNTFNDVQLRYNTPWDATIAIGVVVQLHVDGSHGPPRRRQEHVGIADRDC